jgi:hypothetical protein
MKMKVEKIYYKHYRYFYDQIFDKVSERVERYIRSGPNRSTWMPATKGGMTKAVAVVTYGENTFEISATTRCRTDENFVYALGRKYAKERLDRILGHIQAMENVLSGDLSDGKGT